MKKPIFQMFILGSLFLLLVSACGLLQEPEEASAPIEATPLEIATEEEPAPTAEMVETESAETAAESDSAGVRIYTISQADSEVRFELDEDLRGQRITVVGITDQVAGEIGVDPNDLSSAQVGVMRINARTLMTDNSFRNRAIQNEILRTGEFEFITFTPTAIQGLPESATAGERVSFTVEGELTIRDITQPVTFTVEAGADAENRISGTATAVIQRADFNLNIPSVPNVANVEEEVELYIDFVAVAE